MSTEVKRISQPILGSTQDHFEITTPFSMYVLGYTFLPEGFMREIFRYYQLGLCQLHPNGWINLSTFDKFFRIVEIKLTINVFRTYYHMVTGTDGGNDMRWFFPSPTDPQEP